MSQSTNTICCQVPLTADPEITGKEYRTLPTATPTEGVGCVEAPRGTLTEFTIESEALAGNLLGDPAERDDGPALSTPAIEQERASGAEDAPSGPTALPATSTPPSDAARTASTQSGVR